MDLNNSYKFFASLGNVISLITLVSYTAYPSTATIFTFVDTLETENLLLSLQAKEEEGKTVPPN